MDPADLFLTLLNCQEDDLFALALAADVKPSPATLDQLVDSLASTCLLVSAAPGAKEYDRVHAQVDQAFEMAKELRSGPHRM